MKCIGVDKTDLKFRKFKYDTDVQLLSNPPQYTVEYIDGESPINNNIICDNVIKIKELSDSSQIHIKNNPNPTEESLQKESNVAKSQTKTEKKKSTTKKKSSKKEEKANTNQDVPVITLEDVVKCNINKKKKFEYKIFTITDIPLDNVLESKLNELGDDGWELVAYQYRPQKSNLFITTENIFLGIFKREKGEE